ncbi:uncharacterized protein LOC129716838 [Wyeomyia smithii]|uniref:uncharacterized protein LOC129716838 n=1 Tax=Wyeomyia smithii TaxID=174621 RepID=UPI002467CB74|nr:uncharacterized protein LOC129716838 [Wyeomyia smithii]
MLKFFISEMKCRREKMKLSSSKLQSLLDVAERIDLRLRSPKTRNRMKIFYRGFSMRVCDLSMQSTDLEDCESSFEAQYQPRPCYNHPTNGGCPHDGIGTYICSPSCLHKIGSCDCSYSHEYSKLRNT